MDEELRGHERHLQGDPHDVRRWLRYLALLEQRGAEPPEALAGQARRIRAALAEAPGHASIGVGDLVRVTEHDQPWATSPWRGVVARVEVATDPRGDYLAFWVRPDVDHPIDWRTQPPNHALFVSGLKLGRDDRLELL